MNSITTNTIENDLKRVYRFLSKLGERTDDLRSDEIAEIRKTFGYHKEEKVNVPGTFGAFRVDVYDDPEFDNDFKSFVSWINSNQAKKLFS